MPASGGEGDIIQRFFAPLAANAPGAFGLRDDAACLTPPQGHDVIVSVDAVAAGVHFFADDTPADIGWKALAVNASDLIAKGADPYAYVMAVSFPKRPSDAWLAALASGLAEAQRAFGMTLVGGDTDARPGPITITITALGFVPTGRMVQRTTARVGDIIFVSGTLGDSALGLRARLQPGVPWVARLSPQCASCLAERYLRPAPPLALVGAVREHAQAAMDISDGLIKDLGRMCDASGVGAQLDMGRLPLSAAVSSALVQDSTLSDVIRSGGDDYQVLATVSPAKATLFEASAHRVGVRVTRIGTIVPQGRGIIDETGTHLREGITGYDHF